MAALKLAKVDDITAFCNEAIEYAIKSGHASNATLADVVAGIAALNSRARELTVVQLELMAITLDISLLAEHLTMAAPLLDDIIAAQDRARRTGAPGAKP